jgi:hypothetical protein
MLSLLVLAMLRGCKGPVAIAQFGRDHGQRLAWALGFTRGKSPCAANFCKLLRRLDPIAFEAALSRWICSQLATDQCPVIALDGKTLRGSKDGQIPGQHLVAAYAVHCRAVLAQIRVDAKTNEHKAALALLGILPVKGRIITGDAMFCQRDLAKEVVDQGGDYLFTVKDNQPGLQTDIQAGFAYEATARAIAAAFSPCGDGGTGTGQNGEYDGQGPRQVGATVDPHHQHPDLGPEVERTCARV